MMKVFKSQEELHLARAFAEGIIRGWHPDVLLDDEWFGFHGMVDINIWLDDDPDSPTYNRHKVAGYPLYQKPDGFWETDPSTWDELGVYNPESGRIEHAEYTP
jgi:hypothetical protein